VTALTQIDFDFVKSLIQRKAAIEIDETKRYLAETRLNALAREAGLGDVALLLGRVRADPNGRLADQVTEAMTTNETSFFRDGHPFDAMRQIVIPQLLAGTRSIQVWSAACSTGQEPYSLAMAAREVLPANAAMRILASDINTQVLARAATGEFSQLEVNRGLPAPALVRYFRQTPDLRWQITPELRRMVEFRQINLAAPWPALGPFDIVLLRNALIYLDNATKRSIFERLRRVMRPGAHLFLGTGEAPIPEGVFERVTVGRTVCYRAPSGRN
jgi:chemotaxis protein methyltransferase CheR